MGKASASILLPDISNPAATWSDAERTGAIESSIDDHRLVIIGNPGAGKSTFVRHVMHSSSSDRETSRATFVFELKRYPFNDPKSFHELIAQGARAINHIEVDGPDIRDIFLLGLGNVIFDGLDEVTDLGQRRQLVETLEEFARRFPLVRIMVTSREEGYSSASLNSTLFSVYRLPDFTNAQVQEYVQRWFGLTADPPDDSAYLSSRFLEESEHAADLRTNPLMLSLLCMIYRYEGYIPENRPQVYEDCAELLFDRWDKIRHVRSHIKPDAKGRYLIQELAYFFFTHQRSQGGAEEYILLRLLQEYLSRNIVDDQVEARERARDFLDYCAGRAWLLARVGTSARGERLFGFTHRTFMEYFAGCYFVRHYPGLDQFVERVRMLVDAGSSEIVPQIAIQRFDEGTADGLDDCLSTLLFGSRNLTEKVLSPYIPFVLRCLRFMSPTPHTLEKIFTASFQHYAKSRSAEVLTLLETMNRECRTALTRFCERVVEDSKLAIRPRSLPLVIGCYMMLARIGDGKSRILRRSLEAALLANLQELASLGFSDFISELLSSGLISTPDFAKLCGATRLLAMEVNADGRKILLPGIAALEIEHAYSCSLTSRIFEPSVVLKWVFYDPSNLPSMSRSSAMHFAFSAKGWRTPAALSPGLHKRESLALLRASAVFGLMIIVEADATDIPEWIRNIALRVTKADFFENLRRSREERVALDGLGLSQLHRLGLGPAWSEYVISWTRAEFSIIDE